MNPCSIDGCPEPAHARAWCQRHYRRWLHHGDPLGGKPDAVVRYATTEDLRARLARGLEQIDNPIALAKAYLAKHHLRGGRDEADLLGIAVDAIVDAALAWDPHGGCGIVAWAWLYMDRNVKRELARGLRHRFELGDDGCISDQEWTHYDAGIEPFHRAELRVDLQRWADLAELTPLMRFVVEYAALHHGTYVRDTPLGRAGPTPLHDSGAGALRLALKHLRQAAITNERRDDAWTRARPEGRAGRLAASNRALAEFRAIEDHRDQIIAELRPA